MSKSWMVFAIATMTYMLAFIQRTAPGLVTDRLAHDFQVPASAMGGLAVGQFLAYAALQLPVGLLADRFGPARWLAAGAFLDGFGTIVFSLSHSFSLLLIARGIVGMGDAMLWVNIVLLLARWFSSGVFSRVLATVGMAGGAASALTTLPLAWLLGRWGWRPPFLMMGMLLVLCAGLIAVLLPRWERQSSPYLVKVIASRNSRQVLAHVVGRIRGWLPLLTHFGLIGAYTGFVGIYAVPYLMATHHLARVEASGVESIAMIGTVIAGPLAGWVADRVGAVRPALFGALLALAGWGILSLWPDAPLLVTTGGLWLTAMATGASVVTFSLVRSWFPASEVGSASGFANTGGFTAAALFPFLVGGLIHLGWGTALLPGLGFSLVGLVATVFAWRVAQRDTSAEAAS